MRKLSLLITLTSILGVAHAQTEGERRKITSNYDKNKIEQLKKEFQQLQEQRKASRKNSTFPKFIKSTGASAKNSDFENNHFAELQYIDEQGIPIYYETYNAEAAKSTRTNYLQSGGSLKLDLTGKDMLVGVWDAGGARSTHQEYKNTSNKSRYSYNDTNALNPHSAHVTGTIIAKGVDVKAKGMATEANAKGYDWTNDISEMTNEASSGLLLSNHSYGYTTKQYDNFGNLIFKNNQTVPLLEWYQIGTYMTDTYNLDKLLYAAPNYLAVIAAGNDGIFYINKSPMDSSKPQYDKLTGYGNSKNALIVANAEKAVLNADGSLKSVTINSTSSQGPTRDLRIKPDITGHGTDVYSTLESSDNSYGIMSGTSMASPNVTGTLLLIQEYSNKILKKYLKAATLKGLALHTADDAGLTGPDAIFGWGLLNAKKMAETIKDSEKNPNTIIEATLKNAQTFTKVIKAKAGSKLSVSISWTDPEGKAISNTNEVNNSVLVNDLDLRVTKGSKTYYPWKLMGVDTNSANSDNNRDNFERVDIDNASAEEYTITVSHKGTLKNNKDQDFALIITGIENSINTAPTPPTNLKTNNLKSTTTDIIFTPGTDDVGVVGYDIYLNNKKITENYKTSNTFNLIDLTPNYNYTLELVSVDNEGLRSVKSATLTFKTLLINVAPTPPTNLKTNNLKSTTAEVLFTAGTDDVGVVGYDIYVNNNKIKENLDVTDQINFTGLTPNTSYTIELASVDKEGLRSEKSQALIFKSLINDAVNTAPTPPTGLKVSNAKSTVVDFSFTPGTDDAGIVGYDIYLDSKLISQNTSLTNVLQLSKLTVNTSYTLEMASVDKEDLRSAKSQKLVFSTVDTDPPTTPTNLTVAKTTNNATNIEIKWNFSRDNVAVTKYKVYYNKTVFEVASTQNSIIIGPISIGTHTIKVVAIDAANNESEAATKTYQLSTNTTSSIATVDNTTINIYPNPTIDVLNISGLKGNTSFNIYNLSGNLVISGSTNNQKINVSQLSSGVYILELPTEDKENNKIRFIKK